MKWPVCYRWLTMVTPCEEMGKLGRPEALGSWRAWGGGRQSWRHVWRQDVVPDACFLVFVMELCFLTYRICRILQKPIVSLFLPSLILYQPLVS